LKQLTLTLAAVLVLALFASNPVWAAGGGHEIKKPDSPAEGSSQSQGGLQFLSYAEATKKAAEENKLVMIFFWAEWCRYCVQMRQEVFPLDRVKEAFDKAYFGVSVNTENDPDNLTGRFRPTALPTLAFVRPNGEVLGVLPGAPSADTFIEVLEYVNTEARK